MSQLNLFFFAALVGIENGLFWTKAPFWPEWDGLVGSREEFEKRAVCYFKELIRNKMDASAGELFFRQPDWRFDGGDSSDGDSLETPVVIRPLRVNCPVFVNRKKKETVNVPFDVFVSRPQDKRTVWVPLLDRVFTIPSEGDSEPPIVMELKRILVRENQEENPEFLDRALRITETVGFLFQADVTLSDSAETETNDSPRFCSPKSLGMERTAVHAVSDRSVFGLERETERMKEAFDQPIPESVLLIGPPGSGKTALWRRFAAKAFEANLFESFWEANVVLLAGLKNPLEKIEGLGHWMADQTSKALFHLGNLWEIDQTGKGYNQNQSLADCLTPLIRRGTLPSVAECTPEQYAELDQTHPSILSPWTVITLPDPTPERNLHILKTMNKSLFHGVFSTAGLTRLEALLRRYSSYEAVPGAAVALMSQPSLSKDKKKGTVGESDVTKAFAEQSGLPLFLLDPSAELDREATRRFFSSRVMGQGGNDPVSDADPSTQNTETPDGNADDRPNTASGAASDEGDAGAVPILLDLIEAIKARVTKSDGPIASLLFIGPTGVGKTELAKTLAEFFYGSPKKMVRIDMNEYGQYGAADRLISGTADGGGLLTSAVRAQPFGVVLLDEFEKAHPSVFDLLLQILGEGRLSDTRGRTADFRNSVIILTSNLGMENYGKKSLGFDREKSAFSAAEHFTAEVAKQVRPELLNRIDRIVPFRPLSSETLRRILDREWALLKKRQGITVRRLTLEMDDAVKEELVRLGYDPHRGARPLRRVLERQILLPLAEQLADRPLKEPLLVRFTLKEGTIRITVERQTGKTQNKTEQGEKESTEKTLQALAEARFEMNELRNRFMFTAMRHEVRDWRREKFKNEYVENGETWRCYRRQENFTGNRASADADFEKKEKLLAWFDREYDEFVSMEAEAAIRWEAGRPLDFDEKMISRKKEQIRHHLYLECRPDAQNSSFWFISHRQDFLLFYVRLFDEFCRNSQCCAEFWVAKDLNDRPLSPNAPELSGDEYYPWALNEERVGIAAEPVINQIRQEKSCPKEFRKKGVRFTSLWKIPRDRNKNLVWPDFITQIDPVNQVLMTGIDDPYLRRLFDGLIDRHGGSFKRAKFKLDFFCAGKTPADFLDTHAFEAIVGVPGYLNNGCVWKFSGSGKQTPWFPWKTAELEFFDKGMGVTEKREYDPEKKDSFPECLFTSDLRGFFWNLS